MSAGTELYFQSTVDKLINGIKAYTKQIKHCLSFLKKYEALVDAQQKHRIDKIILILQSFGTKNDFEEQINFSRLEVDEKAKSLIMVIEEMEGIIKLGFIRCPKCYGSGVVTKQEIIRQKEGIRTYLRTRECSVCNGKGKLSMTQNQRAYLGSLLQISNTVVDLGSQFIALFKEYITYLGSRLESTIYDVETERIRAEILRLKEKIEELEKSLS